MKKADSKLIIENTIKSLINNDPILIEGPLDFAKGIGQGVVGAGQNVVGNFNVNRAKSYMDTFGKKTIKNMDSYAEKASNVAQKMQNSKNPAVQATGQEIEQTIQGTKEKIESAVDELNQSFPTAVGKPVSPPIQQQAKVQPSDQPLSKKEKQVKDFQAWFDGKFDIDWKSLGKPAQGKIIDQYFAEKGMKSSKDKESKEEKQQSPVAQSASSEPKEKTKVTKVSDTGGVKTNFAPSNLKDYGIKPEEFALIDNALKMKDKNALELFKAINFKDKKGADFALQSLRQQFEANPEKYTDTGYQNQFVNATTQQNQAIPTVGKKLKVAQPPVQQTNQTLNMKKKLSPSKMKLPPVPTTLTRFVKDRENPANKTNPGIKREGIEGVITMADFMNNYFENDPEQIKMVNEKIKLDK